MSVIAFGVQINVSDSYSGDGLEFGIYSGYCRWVTGVTSYDGFTSVPTGDNEGNVWKNNLLVESKFENPTRSTDIVDSGDYGTLSRFGFCIDNTNVDHTKPFWKYASDLGINFVNREVKFYTIIDDVFYVCWTGVVEETVFDGKEGVHYRFTCGDKFQKIHKVIPPNLVTKESFPDAGDDLIGSPIPISLGYLLRARLYNISSKPHTLPLGTHTGELIPEERVTRSAAVMTYQTPHDQDPYVLLVTPDANFSAGQLSYETGESYFLRGVKGTKQVIRIKTNDATTTDDSSNGTIGCKGITKVYLESPFEEVTEEDFYKYTDIINSGQAFYTGHATVTGAQFTLSNIVGTFNGANNPVQGPYFIGEDSGAAGWSTAGPAYQAGALFATYLRGAFLIGEKIYESTEPVYRATITGDTDKQIAFFTSIKGFRKGFNTDANSKVFIDIVDEGGGARSIKAYKNVNRTSLVFHTASYSTPGVKAIIADNGSGLSGTINIGSVGVANKSIWVGLVGISNGVSATITGIYVKATSQRGFTCLSAWDTCWYFDIVKLTATCAISNSNISEFVTPISGDPFVYFDKDTKTYINMGDLVQQTNLTTSNPYTKPYITLNSDKVDYEGNIARYVPIVPEKVSTGFVGPIVEVPELIDLDRTTSYDIVGTLTTGESRVGENFRVFVPNTTMTFEELYILGDFTVEKMNSVDSRFYINIQHDYYDIFEQIFRKGSAVYLGDNFTVPISGFYSLSPDNPYNFLPDNYYANGGNTNSEPTYWSRSDYDRGPITYRSKHKVPIDVLKSSDETLAVSLVRFYVGANKGKTTTASGITVKVKQIGFVGKKVIQLKSDDLFASVKGETFAGNFVNNVPKVFQHLLETYDGVSSGDYDLGNISTTRSDWFIGRQIIEREQSYEYFRELAEQSFVSIYPAANGDRVFKTWRDYTTVDYTDTQTSVNRDSIKSFSKTPIGRVYNSFNLPYNTDPGIEDFTRILSVSSVDQSAFPAYLLSTGTDSTPSFTSLVVKPQGNKFVLTITAASDILSVGDFVSLTGNADGINIYFAKIVSEASNVYTALLTEFTGPLNVSSTSGTLTKHGTGIPKWTTYVPGIKTYATAEYLWGLCHASYLKNGQILLCPNELSELKWYVDLEQFQTGMGGDDTSAAVKYLIQLCEWSTRQKDIVAYSVPITAANMTRDLLQGIHFSDPIYTNSQNRFGWITKITVNTATCALDLEVMLDIEGLDTCTSVIETGSQVDTINESGSRTNTYTEGVC